MLYQKSLHLLLDVVECVLDVVSEELTFVAGCC